MANNIRHITKHLSSRGCTCILFFIAMLTFMAMNAFAQANKITIYFYSSESTINNFKSLKMEFDRYLIKYGPYEFQPFSDRETFEKQIKDKEHCLIILSSWHYRNIYKDFALTAVLVGTRNGRKYQERILVATDENAKAGRIASASSLQHTSSSLQEMLKGKNSIDITSILTVPKDIDALMSVGFGMSKFALTTKNSFNELKIANQPLHQQLKILAEGEESLLLIGAVPEQFMHDAQNIVTIIQNMTADQGAKEKLRMLELDGWQTLEPTDRLKLETK
jgi:hypothetical protein